LIPFIVRNLQAAKPKSVLDIGIGMGKWGALAHEYCDGWNLRYAEEDWLVSMTGIEAFPAYINDATRCHYDEIIIGDACETLPGMREAFDVVLAIDVIEHQEKDKALELLRQCVKHARHSVIAAIPLGEAWLDCNIPYRKVNAFEEHKSAWTEEDVHSEIVLERQVVEAPRGKIGGYVLAGGVQ
jgi:SAM-dependent methyltransferase